MADEDNYGGVQQPEESYGSKAAAEDYGDYQTSPSPYAADGAAKPTLTSGLPNGINLQPSYFNGGNVDLGWGLIRQKPKIKAVRIEIEPGQEQNAQRWIKEAATNGYAIIATYHKHTVLGSDDDSELAQAADWWATNYPSLKTSGAFAINLMNEWGGHGITEQDFAASYNRAIAKVRSVYDGPIIIDLPGYGQEAHTAALAVKGAPPLIRDRRIVLSTHIYPGAWNQGRQRGMATADIDELHATGVACIVGEFGDTGTTGRTPWRDLVRYAKSKKWPIFGWAWDGDGGSMNMISPQFQPFVPGTPQQYTTTQYFNTIYSCL